jgi:hypothetical protein
MQHFPMRQFAHRRRTLGWHAADALHRQGIAAGALHRVVVPRTRRCRARRDHAPFYGKIGNSNPTGFVQLALEPQKVEIERRKCCGTCVNKSKKILHFQLFISLPLDF